MGCILCCYCPFIRAGKIKFRKEKPPIFRPQIQFLRFLGAIHPIRVYKEHQQIVGELLCRFELGPTDSLSGKISFAVIRFVSQFLSLNYNNIVNTGSY